MADIYRQGATSYGKNSTPGYADSQEGKTLRKLMDWWSQARSIHAQNREQQLVDQDYKDGFQWTDEDRQALQNRGQ